MDHRFSFCEAVTAGPYGRWHIRKLTEHGPKYGGGIDSPSLCGHVDPKRGGWDIKVVLTDHHLSHACPECSAKYAEEINEDGS